ncbi:helix-turn-helix domain-containing protein [Microbacteriaceae bacterium K1510]|nr:helix-turn-helix domain-containing protein [Microbacteriaceae bacterium K1510]
MSELATAAPGIGRQALAALRAATVDICDVIPLGSPDDFEVVSTTRMTGKGLLVEAVSTPLEYDRTAAHVARGGIDHYHITLCFQGQMRFASGRREITLRPGDVGLIDMAQPNRTWLTGVGEDRSRLASLILPRALLAPRLAHPDSSSATFLPGHDRRARLLADQFAALWQQPETADAAAMTEAIVDGMCDVIAEVAGRAADAHGDAGRAERRLLLAAIKQHIDANLYTGTLSADDLCDRFRLSRASLYRLFEADGGLAHYVQDQRLNRALLLLISPAARSKRLIDLAVELQFSGDSTFVRAFRRQFGLTPGEVRDRAEAWSRETSVTEGPLHILGRR